jgi:hypothetical protein
MGQHIGRDEQASLAVAIIGRILTEAIKVN